MSLPHEEVAALKKSRAMLVKLRNDSLSPFYFFKMMCSKKKRKKLNSDLYSCFKHYPYDYDIDKRWNDSICQDCRDSHGFCKC